MSIFVICNSCAAEFELRDDAAGKKVRCNSCGRTIRVPRPTKPSRESLDDLDEPDEARVSPRRRPGRSRNQRGPKWQQSALQSLSSAQEFFQQMWSNSSAAAVALGIYALAFVAGIFVPDIFVLISLICIPVGGLLILIGEFCLFCVILWHNIFLIFLLPLVPMFWVAILFWDIEHTQQARQLVLWGFLVFFGGWLPYLCCDFLGACPNIDLCAS